MSEEKQKLVTGELLEVNIGEVLGGVYKLQGKLGVGAMGEVFRAEDLNLKRSVAIKFLNPIIADSAEVVELFRSEARALARLNHPYIVQVYTFGEERGYLYFVMEHIAGETLQSKIKVEQRFLPRSAAPILKEVAEALIASHAGGMIHRDLKPANVMILPSKHIKVMDFGLAGVAATATGKAMGTARYMAPEQAQGLKLDGRADLYSFGVILYEMLVGDVPFDGANYRKTLEMHVNSPVPPPRVRRPDIPVDWESLIMRLLSKDPEGRPANAKELLAQIDKLVNRAEAKTAANTKTSPEIEIKKLYKKARAHFEIGELDRAGEILDQLFSQEPKNSKAWNLKGAVELKSNRLAEASGAFAKAFAIKPDFFEAALNLGISLQKQKRSAEAIWAFDHAVKIMPSAAAGWIHLGEARLAMKDLPGAKISWAKALQLEPGNLGLKKRFEELKKAMAI